MNNIIEQDRIIRELTDTELSQRMKGIICKELSDTFQVVAAQLTIEDGHKDEKLAKRCGHLAELQENEEALVLLEAMRRLATKEV